MLQWRTYRIPQRAPCPVLERAAPRYVMTGAAEPQGAVDVGTYTTAEAVRSGQQFSAGEPIPEVLLREDIVLVRDGARRRIARAVAPTPFLESPFLGDPAVVVDPLRRQDRVHQWRVFQPEAVRDGVFLLPPGIEGQLIFRVDGSKQTVVYDHNEITGAVWAEVPDLSDLSSPGAPLGKELDVTIALRVDGMYARMLELQKEVITHPVSGKIRGIAHRQPERLRDIRRLCHPAQEGRDAAMDYGQFDGKPLADQFYWEIVTDATSDEIQQAVRRTLPVGTVYKITRP